MTSGRSTARPDAPRFWELDAARTVAVVMMSAYHAAYDVWFLAPSVGFDPFGGGWRALQVATGSTFITLVGVSLAVGNGRARARGVAGVALWRRHARRAVEVLAAATLVSAATRVALGPEDYIRFGVLHCIGTMMLLLPLFVPLGPWVNAALGAVALVAGFAVRGHASTVPGALVLGTPPPGGAGVDWYPLLPWGGLALIGLAVGTLAYPGGVPAPPLARAARRLGDALGRPRLAALTWPGRHALPIYLAHQLVLVALVAAVLAVLGVAIDPRTG
ncbi:MAG: DUF1624 domain-containing protein [Thermoleophilia bacterium]|nr:DUF1624 domain-containing protein [Thermoleophilia bacterium]